MFKRGYNYIALTLIETSNDGGGFTIRNVSNSQTLLVTANKSLLSSMISWSNFFLLSVLHKKIRSQTIVISIIPEGIKEKRSLTSESV